MPAHSGKRILGLLRREALATAVPVGAALAIALVAAPDLLARRPDEERPRADVPPAKHLRELDRGDWRRVDLAGLEQRYQDLKLTLARAFARSPKRAATPKPGPYDIGLPRCGRSRVRTFTPHRDLPRGLVGRKLFFGAVGRGGSLRLPREIAEDPRAAILITRLPRLTDLGSVSKRLGRTVSLATRDLARALGVRCTNTWLEVRKKDHVILHEGR